MNELEFVSFLREHDFLYDTTTGRVLEKVDHSDGKYHRETVCNWKISSMNDRAITRLIVDNQIFRSEELNRLKALMLIKGINIPITDLRT